MISSGSRASLLIGTKSISTPAPTGQRICGCDT